MKLVHLFGFITKKLQYFFTFSGLCIVILICENDEQVAHFFSLIFYK